MRERMRVVKGENKMRERTRYNERKRENEI